MVDLGSVAFGAFGAALLSVIAGFVGAYIASRREHAKWVRQERYSAYATYMGLLERLPTVKMSVADLEFMSQIVSATAAVRLLGSREVVEAADAATREALASAKDKTLGNASFFMAREHLVAVAKKELNVPA
jgi:hypothetical protein